LWVINALTNEYDLYFGHILEPQKYASNESKSYLKKLIRESLNVIFEADSDGEKRKMIVLVGPPSVGKSTWIKSNFPNAYIINRDDIVEKVASSYGWTYDDIYVTPPSDAEIGDVDEKFGNVIPAPEWMTWTKNVFDKVKEANEKIKPLMNSRMSGAHNSNQDVVVDMTHMTKSERNMTIKGLESGGVDYHKVAVDFKFKGAEDVIKRVSEKRAETAKRMGKSKTIPSASFDRMFSSYEEPTKDEGFDEIISIDNIENLKKSLNESIINIVRESINKR
jgi:tRNA uridine 5-carbamoylmethylation protein Kti12